jgi:small subunit ribosomal protein S13
MPRISGIDIPVNKQAWVSLTYIYGIGPAKSYKILNQAGIAPEVRVKDLTEAEINKLREIIDKQYRVEGEARKEVSGAIKRLIEIGSYRGLRHRHGLPARGQRTRTNARTKKGKPKTVAGRGQKRGATKK